MTDYISREEATELLSQPITMSMCLSTEECRHKIAQQRIDRYLIENIPAADVRPVILCGECEFWTKSGKSLQGRCALLCIYPTATWYCANAKRRESA